MFLWLLFRRVLKRVAIVAAWPRSSRIVGSCVGAGAGPVGAQRRRRRRTRIISLIPATTEMLFAMGAGDRVVGVSSYDHFPPEVEQLPKVGGLLDPERRADPLAEAGSRHRLRHADRSEAAARRARHSDCSVRAPRPARHHGDDPRARRAGRRRRPPADALAARIERQLADDSRARGRTAAAEDAAGLRPRAGDAAQHRRERRLRVPARHARDRRRRGRARRPQAAVGGR